MNTVKLTSVLQNPNEHKTCSNYRVDVDTGFHIGTCRTGEAFPQLLPQYNHLMFVREGSLKLSCNEYIGRKVGAGEMIFIPSNASFAGEVLADAEWIDMVFDVPISGCDKFKMQSLRPICESITYHFEPLPIREPLVEFLNLLAYCIRAGVNCMHLHTIKHQEAFLYIHGFYTREEVAQLFYPIVGKSLSFRETIVNLASEAISVNDLVERTNMSRRTFQRKFLEEFHEPAKKWLQKRLSIRVMNYLMDPENSLKDIMYECGFSSSSSFNQFCQKNFGESPSELRKKIVQSQHSAEKLNKTSQKQNAASQY